MIQLRISMIYYSYLVGLTLQVNFKHNDAMFRQKCVELNDILQSKLLVTTLVRGSKNCSYFDNAWNVF